MNSVIPPKAKVRIKPLSIHIRSLTPGRLNFLRSLSLNRRPNFDEAPTFTFSRATLGSMGDSFHSLKRDNVCCFRQNSCRIFCSMFKFGIWGKMKLTYTNEFFTKQKTTRVLPKIENLSKFRNWQIFAFLYQFHNNKNQKFSTNSSEWRTYHLQKGTGNFASCFKFWVLNLGEFSILDLILLQNRCKRQESANSEFEKNLDFGYIFCSEESIVDFMFCQMSNLDIEKSTWILPNATYVVSGRSNNYWDKLS